MISLLIHGCYDSNTLDTLRNLSVKEFSFDLRGRSPNLVTYNDLKKILPTVSKEKIFLTFENDSKEMILSYLDLLKEFSGEFRVILRGHHSNDFYKSISVPFFWLYNPLDDLKSILESPKIKGVLLPVKFQNVFVNYPLLWEVIDRRNLEVYIHAENFQEISTLKLEDDIKISLELTSEVETSYRHVDQEKLKRMKFWRFNENPALK